MMGYGYENAAGDRISALIDMINGGGPGRSGGTFEGGGILSLLANAVAKPYGSVRERPGHTPMGATAAPMEVLRPVARPVATDAGVGAVDTSGLPAAEERPVLPGLAESVEEGYRGAIFRPTFSPAATGGRRFMEEDLALLPSLHPDVRALFSEVKLGEVLPAPLAMFLDVARVGSAAPVAGPMQGPPAPVTPVAGPMQGPPAPVTTAYDFLDDSTFFTQDQLDAMSPDIRAMAEEHNMLASEVFRVPAAPPVSPLPEAGPEPRPYTPGTDNFFRVPLPGWGTIHVFLDGTMKFGENVYNDDGELIFRAGQGLIPGSDFYDSVMARVNRGL